MYDQRALSSKKNSKSLLNQCRRQIMTNKTFSREELYQLVWSKPVSKLAIELGLSTFEIRKLCRDKEIPLPEQGHWAKLQFGKAVVQIPLPPKEIIPVIKAKPSETHEEEPIISPHETELPFKVPERLLNPDPLILEAEKGLRREQYHASDHGTVSTGTVLPIRVTKANINRALRIMDTLVKCWKKRGYYIEARGNDTYVCLRKVDLRIRLWELTKKLPKASDRDRQRYEPTGQLAFKTDYWMGREWKDGRLMLEDQILNILNHMELAARDLERTWAENKRREEERNIAVKLEREKLKKQKGSKIAFKKLLKEANRWKKLKTLDEYLKKLRETKDPSPAFKKWLQWAKEYRLAADPFLNLHVNYIDPTELVEQGEIIKSIK
jgi:hypothetical protein